MAWDNHSYGFDPKVDRLDEFFTFWCMQRLKEKLMRVQRGQPTQRCEAVTTSPTAYTRRGFQCASTALIIRDKRYLCGTHEKQQDVTFVGGTHTINWEYKQVLDLIIYHCDRSAVFRHLLKRFINEESNDSTERPHIV